MPPIIIGVAGGSASGKTTVVRQVVEALGQEMVAVVEHDRYYRDHALLSDVERAALNFDHPDALETDLLVEHLATLRAGRPIDAPMYDFARHARRATRERIEARPAIIIEGILVLAEPRLREAMDLRVFVDTPDDERFRRRLVRDTVGRGRTVAAVTAQYENTVRPMHVEFVEPSRHHAHIVVPDGGDNDDGVREVIARVMACLSPDRASRRLE